MDDGIEDMDDGTDIARQMVAADLEQLKSTWGEGLEEAVAGLSDEQIHELAMQAWRHQFPGAMLCGAAHMAQEIVIGYQKAMEVGASPLTFQGIVLQMCNHVLMAHVGHHDRPASSAGTGLIIPGSN